MAKHVEDERLSLAYRELSVVPQQMIAKHRKHVRDLDLSHNKLIDMKFLEEFENLKSLVLDNNNLPSRVQFCPVEQLETLWVNHNNITNLSVFIESVSKNFPNLKYFSMMHNPAAPSYFNGGSFQQYKDYRYYVISHLPNLLVVDDTPITEEEREEARKIYGNRRYSIKSTTNKKKKKEKKNKALKTVCKSLVLDEVNQQSKIEIIQGSYA